MNDPASPPAEGPPWRAATRAVVAGRPEPSADAPLSTPVVATSTYAAGGERGYGRYTNPTWEAFEDAVGSLEGATAVAYASGMAAVAAAVEVLLADAPPHGAVVVPADGYHASVDLLSRLSRPVRSVRLDDPAGVQAALDGAVLLWAESPTNPLLEVPDLSVLVAHAHQAGARIAVDTTAATPLRVRPAEHGADVVVHAATKYLSGHSDLLMGVAASRDPAVVTRLREVRSRSGAIPGTFEAWLALRGLRTLLVRLDRAEQSAQYLAACLAGHSSVQRVRYPGWGGLVSVQVHGGAARADAVTGATRLWVPATSFGGVESTLERRRRWPAERASVPESLIRLSVGLEDPDDLWQDLEQALTRTRPRGTAEPPSSAGG